MPHTRGNRGLLRDGNRISCNNGGFADVAGTSCRNLADGQLFKKKRCTSGPYFFESFANLSSRVFQMAYSGVAMAMDG